MSALVVFHALFRFVIGGQGCGLLAQGVDLPLHDGEALALRHLLVLRRLVVGGKSLGLLGERSDLQCQAG